MQKRIPYFDAMRAYGAVLGILFHSSLGYLAHPIAEWPKGTGGSAIFDYIAFILHMFRVPAFFFIAGFFAYQLFIKLKVRDFLNNRFKRIVIPLILSALFFNIPSLLTNIYFHNIHSFYNLYIALSNIGYNWFLEYLLLYYILFLLTINFLSLPKVTAITRTLVKSKWNILAFSLIIAVSMCCYGSDYLPSSLLIIPNPWVFLIYGLYFVLGTLFAKNIDLFECYFKWNWIFLALALVALIVDLLLLQLTAQHYLAATFYCCSSFLLFYCFICACIKWCHKENATVKYLSEASYWIYLTQVPIIIQLQGFFSILNNIFLQWIFTVILTLIIVLFSYDLLIRPKPVIVMDYPH